jgi:hypothetical protein
MASTRWAGESIAYSAAGCHRMSYETSGAAGSDITTQ